MKLIRSPIVLLTLILFMLVSLYRLWGAFSEYQDLQETRAKMEEKLAYYEEEHRRLRQEIRLSHTAEARERDAKSRLNQKLPGEKVVVVVSDATTTQEAPREAGFWKKLIAALHFWN